MNLSLLFFNNIVEFFLMGSVFLILLYNSFILARTDFNFPILDKNTYLQSLFILIIALILNFLSINIGFSFYGLFSADNSSLLIKSIVLVAAVGSLVCGQPYLLVKKINLFEYYIILLLAVFSLLFLAEATDLMSIYLCIEMQSLCLYVLAAFNRYSVFSTEAALKYFILGAFSSCFFLLGAVILYGVTGLTNLYDLSLVMSGFSSQDNFALLVYISVISLLVTLFFKITAAPFHIWSPDVYEGSPFSSTLIFVLVPKTIFLLLLARICYISFYDLFLSNNYGILQYIFIFCGVLSVLIGSLGALQQRRIKRLLIYSSISHVGFILLGYATASVAGLVSVFYYIIFYIVTGILVWGIFACLSISNKNNFLYLNDFSVLSKKNPALALALGLGFFSFAGVPPLVGFSMKFFIFSAAVQSQMFEISGLILILSVLGSFYYLRFIKILFFEKKSDKSESNIIFISEPYEALYLMLSLCLFLLLFGFINPDIFLLVAYKIGLGVS